MSQYVDTPTKSFVCDEAIAIWLRAKMDADGRVTIAGAADQDIGVSAAATFAAGESLPIVLLSKQGTHKAVAAGAIAAGAKVYGAAAGKVNDVQATGSFLRGVALEAAGADNDVIEILPMVGDTAGA